MRPQIWLMSFLILTSGWGTANVTAAPAAPAASSATSTAAVSLNEGFKAALQRSETLADQDELILQAEEHYRQALGAVYPQLSLSGYYQVQDTSGGATWDQSQLKATATQSLFKGFREAAALRQTEQLIAYQKEAKQWAGLQLYQDLAANFYTILYLEKDLTRVDTELALYQQRIAELNGFIRIGRSRPNEVLTVQSTQAILKAEKVQLQSQLATARELFAFLTGLPANTALRDENPVPAAIDPLESYLGELKNRPDITVAQKKIAAVRENVAIAKGGRLPSVDATANVYAIRPTSNQKTHWDAQIALTLPLFTGGTLTSKVAEAESQVRETELALQRLQRLDEEELRNDYSNLQAGLAQAAALEEAANLAHKNYLAEARDYRNGLVNNLDVLQALATDQDAQRALDKARFSIQIDYQRLEAAAARRLNLLGGNSK